MKLPIEFEENMKAMLGKKFDKYILSLQENAKRGLRVNKNYVNVKDFLKIFPYKVKNILNIDNYFELQTDEKIGNSVFHHLGEIYLQEPSSMLACVALDVKNGEKVLDLCAAPGGKTSQILENNKDGIVVSNEIVRARANILLSNVERQGFRNSLITSLSPEFLAENIGCYFDKILVDAPCSGEGMFRKDPETISEWNKGLPEFNHNRDMQILQQADKMLKNGGTLVYSTCTFNQEEDEKVVSLFAKQFGYDIVQLPQCVINHTEQGIDIDGQKTSLSRKCFPFSDFGEGQFIAKLIKKTDNLYEKPAKKHIKNEKMSKIELKIVQEFLTNTINRSNFYFYKFNNNIYISEIEMPNIDFGVVSLGTLVGELKKERIEPAHQFFKAYGKEFINTINLDFNDEKVLQYIKGYEIDTTNNNGFVCVQVLGVPLGGGKVVSGKVKNYYPKGLRN